jgi:phosphate transport system protein
MRQLKERILAMGGKVERAIECATQGLIERRPERFDEVFAVETEINRDHMAIDEACVQLLARQSPLASSLRLVVAVIKINTDLERMGDQAVNISHNSRRYIAEPPLKPLVDIPKMATEVRTMVRESLDSFVKGDVPLARQVLSRDDEVDRLKAEVLTELTGLMEKDSRAVQRAINLILIAQNLERLGDHATNIAENVIFVMTGEDIRHGARNKPPAR